MKDILRNAVDHNYAFWICLIVAILLLISSFIIPPTGLIDSSVLLGVSELWGFGALGSLTAAINKGMNAKVKKGDTSLEVAARKNNRDEDDLRD